MAGIRQKASGICQHAYKAGKVTETCKGAKMGFHAGSVIVKPPGAAVLELGNGLTVLETAHNGFNGCIVIGA